MNRSVVAVVLLALPSSLRAASSPPPARTTPAAVSAAPSPAPPGSLSPAELSRRTTVLAEELFDAEKKTAAKLRTIAEERGQGDARVALERLLYDDVLNLIDGALLADGKNAHAHSLAAQVLMLKSYDGDGTYDVCTLLDAQDQADAVVANIKAAPADLQSAHAILHRIETIPRNRINGQEGDCDDASGDDGDTPSPNGS